MSAILNSADTNTVKPYAISVFWHARWRTVCLVLLLIFGQAVLLHHVVQHHLDHALVHQEGEGDCSFCTIGGHMAASTPSPSPTPLVWAEVVYPFLAVRFLAANDTLILRARAPPSSSVV